jgi:hypothetical protein
MGLSNRLVEHLALSSGELELLRGRLAGAVGGLDRTLVLGIWIRICGWRTTYRESASTPRAATADLRDVAEEREDGLVAQRDVDHAVVGQGAHGGDGRALLPAAHGAGRDEEAGVLAPVAASLPLAAGLWYCLLALHSLKFHFQVT